MSKAKKFWDKQSSRFEKQAEKDEQSFAKLLPKVKPHLRETDILLDFACGIGTSSFQMIDYVHEIVATDISPGMIKVAQKRMKNLPEKKIEFIPTTIFDEQFKNESFDVITAFNIMHLLENPQVEVQRIYQLLKPGGLFISSTAFLGEKSATRFIFFLIQKIGFVPNLKLLKVNDFEKLMLSEKFEIVECKKTREPTPFAFIVAKKP